MLGRCHVRDVVAATDQRARTDQPTGASSTGGGSGGAMTSMTGGAAATSSARRPSCRISGVQRLHDMTVPNSVHFQQVGQQTFITPAHSQQRRPASGPPFVDGAETVTGSAQIEISARAFYALTRSAIRLNCLRWVRS